MPFHKDLIGDDLHIGKADSGSGTPVGNVTPSVVGQFYFDNNTRILYVATGLINTNWDIVTANITLPKVYKISSTVGHSTSVDDNYILINSMTITPAAGTYAVFFEAETQGNSNRTLSVVIAIDGVTLADTVRRRDFGSSNIGHVGVNYRVDVNGSQAIEVRFKKESGGGDVSILNRSLVLVEGVSA
jgi:hypothetical protein